MSFENSPGPAYFFDQDYHWRLLNRMMDSLWAGSSLKVAARPTGAEKTTISQKLMTSVPEKTRIIWLDKPPDTSDELLLFLTQELHICPESSDSVRYYGVFGKAPKRGQSLPGDYR